MSPPGTRWRAATLLAIGLAAAVLLALLLVRTEGGAATRRAPGEPHTGSREDAPNAVRDADARPTDTPPPSEDRRAPEPDATPPPSEDGRAAEPDDGSGPFVVPVRVTRDGVPLAGATLRLRSDTGWSASARTGADGACTLALPRDARLVLEVDAPDRTRQAFTCDLGPPGEPPPINTLALAHEAEIETGSPPAWDFERGLTFSDVSIEAPLAGEVLHVALLGPVRLAGVVVDHEGAPVAGAAVWFEPVERQGGLLETTSDAQGRFALEAPSLALADPGLVRAEARTKGFGAAVVEVDHDGPVPAFRPVRVALEPARPFALRVTDLAGRPLPARVEVKGSFPAPFDVEHRWRRTCGSDGWARIAALPPQQRAWTCLSVAVELEGYERAEEELRLAPGTSQASVVLRALTTWRGRVIGPRGEPVVGAQIRRLERSSDLARRYGRLHGEPAGDVLDQVEPAATSDAQGRFSVVLPEDGALLRVDAPGHGERLLEVAPPVSELEVTLPAGLSLAGTLEGPGGPLARRLLVIAPAGQHPDQAELRPTLAREGRTRVLAPAEVPTALAGAVTDEAGAFRFVDVPPGSHDLFVYWVVEGLWTAVRVGAVTAPRPQVLTFTPPPSAGVVLRPVSAEDGAPLTGVSARLFDADGVQRGYGVQSGELLELQSWRFGALSLEVRHHDTLPLVKPITLAPGQRLDLGALALARGGARLVVRIEGDERFWRWTVSARDPRTGHTVDGRGTLGGPPSDTAFHLSPGAAEVRVACFDAADARVETFTATAELVEGEVVNLVVDLSP